MQLAVLRSCPEGRPETCYTASEHATERAAALSSPTPVAVEAAAVAESAVFESVVGAGCVAAAAAAAGLPWGSQIELVGYRNLWL